jgi:hypothetical protein
MADASRPADARVQSPEPTVDAHLPVPAVPDVAWPMDLRTGEPRRPWSAWAGGALLFAAAALITVALLLVMWDSIRRFPEASWFNRVTPTNLGDPLRILLAVGDFAIAVAIAAPATIAGYYGWAGYRWARVAALIALVLGGGSFALNWLAPWVLLPLALGALALWAPPTGRYFSAWHGVRHPAPRPEPEAETVRYGPLPRYR